MNALWVVLVQFLLLVLVMGYYHDRRHRGLTRGSGGRGSKSARAAEQERRYRWGLGG
jgi:hypothetical protein